MIYGDSPQLYKETNENWRKANQAHVNEYYGKYHAERRFKSNSGLGVSITLTLDITKENYIKLNDIQPTNIITDEYMKADYIGKYKYTFFDVR
jgi:hypothetical protein